MSVQYAQCNSLFTLALHPMAFSFSPVYHVLILDSLLAKIPWPGERAPGKPGSLEPQSGRGWERGRDRGLQGGRPGRGRSR